MKHHYYESELIWEGNRGEGTSSYESYGREYRINVDGKPVLDGSADPLFRGEGDKHNPEDLFLAAVSSCHMLTYLALCARNSICVVAYRDRAKGTMVFAGDGGGRFVEITLQPTVTVSRAGEADLAAALHDRAHELCFIANSCSVPIRHRATVINDREEVEGMK